jgi:AraC-like DNA-binding protein
MEARRLPRFKIFESTDIDESLSALNQSFGQTTSVDRLSSMSLTSMSSAPISRLFLVDFRSTHSLLIDRKDSRDSIAINIPLSGSQQLISREKGKVVAFEKFGAVVPLEGDTKSIVSDYHGLTLVIPRLALQEGLESLVGKTKFVDFDLSLDTQSAGGGIISRSIEMAASQLKEVQSPLGRLAVAARFEEFIVNAVLYGQPHNFLEAINGERRFATPKQVRRAEEYIRAHSSEVIKLSQIAAAAGCSVRSLQLAFRSFRETTPMSLVRELRLAQAYSELLEADPGITTVTQIAFKYGFYNLGRFAQDCRRTFGQSPSEILRLSSSKYQPTL